MREFRKLQKKQNKIMKCLIIFAAVYIFVFIGIQPSVTDYNQTLAIIMNYIADALVLSVMGFLFYYYSKYGKCDGYLDRIEFELSDSGYYFTSRSEKNIDDYSEAIFNDLKNCKFSVSKNIEIEDFEFYARAYKNSEFFYLAAVGELDKNDMLAYGDVAVNDLTVKNLKRKGNGVICFVTDKADDDAIAISKVITAFGRKDQLKVSYAIAELSTSRVYFLGNKVSKLQQMTANYVMNCDVPIKEQYIGKEKLPFQDELEEKMKTFNLKDFKDGTFYAHE